MITQHEEALRIRDQLAAYVASEVARYGTTTALAASPRVRFAWPPPRVSQDFHVTGDQFTEQSEVVLDGERMPVLVATTRYGVFGKVQGLWYEGRAETLGELLTQLQVLAQPLIFRQHLIAQLLGHPSRFRGAISELAPLDLLKLFYSPDRDISHEAAIAVETHASSHVFGESLVFIVRDRTHPHRRAAQWAALDLWEDLPSFVTHESLASSAVEAIRDLLWDAEDDFARTIYKAGVVLGGHICTEEAALALLSCFDAPSRIGRRAVYHASFHLAEWLPDFRAKIVTELRRRVQIEPEPVLREYAERMASDIASEAPDHIADPLFDGE